MAVGKYALRWSVMEGMSRHSLRTEWHKDIKGKSVGQDLFVKNAKKKKRKKATVAILEAKYNSR